MGARRTAHRKMTRAIGGRRGCFGARVLLFVAECLIDSRGGIGIQRATRVELNFDPVQLADCLLRDGLGAVPVASVNEDHLIAEVRARDHLKSLDDRWVLIDRENDIVDVFESTHKTEPVALIEDDLSLFEKLLPVIVHNDDYMIAQSGCCLDHVQVTAVERVEVATHYNDLHGTRA